MTTIRVLRPEDERGEFRSGEADLDRFFAKYAGQNQFKHHIGTTYVAVGEDGKVVGYATVAAGSMEIEELPEEQVKKLPRYPMPILRLARLATDEGARGQGIGKALLRYVLELGVRMSESYGCLGVVVDAKPGAEGFYEGLGFEELEVIAGGSEEKPEPKAMWLPIAEVVAARGRRTGPTVKKTRR